MRLHSSTRAQTRRNSCAKKAVGLANLFFRMPYGPASGSTKIRDCVNLNAVPVGRSVYVVSGVK